MARTNDRSQLLQAAVLGVSQGVTELLPLSSSAHTKLVGIALGDSWLDRDQAKRKSFEVVIHGAAAIGIAARNLNSVRQFLRATGSRSLTLALLTTAPAAIVGLTFRRPISEKLSGSSSIAFGLAFGSTALFLADHRGCGNRGSEDLSTADAALLGIAQATALMPGVSRLGATVATGRAVGLSRPESLRVAQMVGLPVMLAATATQCAGHLRRLPKNDRSIFLVGTVTALLASLIPYSSITKCAVKCIPQICCYRLLLAAALIRPKFKRGVRAA